MIMIKSIARREIIFSARHNTSMLIAFDLYNCTVYATATNLSFSIIHSFPSCLRRLFLSFFFCFVSFKISKHGIAQNEYDRAKWILQWQWPSSRIIHVLKRIIRNVWKQREEKNKSTVTHKHINTRKETHTKHTHTQRPQTFVFIAFWCWQVNNYVSLPFFFGVNRIFNICWYIWYRFSNEI